MAYRPPMDPFMAPTQIDVQPYQPNFNLMMASMQANQQFYDENMARLRESYDTLPGDSSDRDNLLTELGTLADNTTETYMSQGVGQGQRALRSAVQKLEKDIRPGGRVYEWQKNLGHYQSFRDEQRKRLDKGDITEAQYWASVQDPISDFRSFNDDGTLNTLDLRARETAIDVDALAKTYLANKESEYTEKYGAPQRIAGKLVWRKDGRDVITEDEIMKEFGLTLRNEMGRTGQLEDQYMYDVTRGAVNPQGLMQDTISGLYNIESGIKDTLASLENDELNEQASLLMRGLTPSDGKSYRQAKEVVMTRLRENLQALEQDKNLTLNGDPNQVAYSLWEQKTIDDYVRPYAQAKSRVKSTVDMSVYSDPIFDRQTRIMLKGMEREAEDKKLLSRKRFGTIKNPQIDVTGKEYGLTTDQAGFAKSVGLKSNLISDTGRGFEIKSTGVKAPTILDLWDKVSKSDNPVAARQSFKNDEYLRNSTILALDKYLMDNPELVINGKAAADIVSEYEAGLEAIRNTGERVKNFEQVYFPILDAMSAMRNVDYMYTQYEGDGDQRKITENVLGTYQNKAFVPGSMVNSKIYYLNKETQEFEEMDYDGLLNNMSPGWEKKSNIQKSDIITGARALGETKPWNPMQLPTGHYATVVGKDGTEHEIIVATTSEEENKYLELLSKAAKSMYTLEEEDILIPMTTDDGSITMIEATSAPEIYQEWDSSTGQYKYKTTANIIIYNDNYESEIIPYEELHEQMNKENPFEGFYHKRILPLRNE